MQIGNRKHEKHFETRIKSKFTNDPFSKKLNTEVREPDY